MKNQDSKQSQQQESTSSRHTKEWKKQAIEEAKEIKTRQMRARAYEAEYMKTQQDNGMNNT